jgi:hypothetical protein
MKKDHPHLCPKESAPLDFAFLVNVTCALQIKIHSLRAHDYLRYRIGSSEELIELFRERLDDLDVTSGVIALQAGLQASAVRRLLTAPNLNPKFETVLIVADALDFDIFLKPRQSKYETLRRINRSGSDGSLN